MKAGQGRRQGPRPDGLSIWRIYGWTEVPGKRRVTAPLPAFRTALLSFCHKGRGAFKAAQFRFFPKPYLIWSGNRNIAFEEWDLWTHSGSRLSSSLGRPSKSARRVGGVSRNRGTSLYNLTTCRGDFQRPRTTRRSKSGRKLYAKRKKRGQFQDIHSWKRAHGQDTAAVRQKHNRPPFQPHC